MNVQRGASSPTHIRVATWNVLHGRSWPNRRGYRRATFADAIRSIDADLLALQEVDRRVVRTRFADQARTAADAGRHSQYSFVGAQWLGPGGYMGNALLVRGELSDAEAIWHPTKFLSERRNAILGTAKVAGIECSIAATHLQNEPRQAMAGLEMTIERLLLRPGPHIIAGDLNLSTRACKSVLEGTGFELLDRYGADGRVITHDGKPRIDHIVARGFAGSEVEYAKPAISDHAPIVAELTQDA